jgi:hypothetical protein
MDSPQQEFGGNEEYGRHPGNYRFDKTITLGNLLTIITLISGMAVAWFRMDARVTILENTVSEQIHSQQRQDDILEQLQIQQAQLKQILEDTNKSVKELR